MRCVVAIVLPLIAALTMPARAAPMVVDRGVLHVQVILDHLGFAPGILDGQGGPSLTAAIRGFQESRGLPITGRPDQATLRALYPYREKRPTVTIALTADALAGPFVPIPKDYGKQAAMRALGYASPMEKLAEMFHTTPAVLLALNSPTTRLAPGSTIVFPNALPGSRDYPTDLSDVWRDRLSMLNVDARQPLANHLVIDRAEQVLRVLNADNRLIAQFPAASGPGDALEGGVGMDGMPGRATIARITRDGGIRLNIWDAARLSLMMQRRTTVAFQSRHCARPLLAGKAVHR